MYQQVSIDGAYDQEIQRHVDEVTLDVAEDLLDFGDGQVLVRDVANLAEATMLADRMIQ